MIDMKGKTYGKWTVLGFSHSTEKRTFWVCKCQCGTVRSLDGYNLRRGRSTQCQSCGNTRHGMWGSPGYSNWKAMIGRCHNPKNANFPRYGGRAVMVCERWHSPRNFLKDMGQPPDGYSIERKDVNGHYCPENCIWASEKSQQNNRRNNTLITFAGSTRTLQQWADETNIDRRVISARLDAGWHVEEALTTAA